MIALATVILLVPAANAQPAFNPEKYVSFPDEHVGLNKYLKSTEPNADGEYTLRLETFITGSVSKRVVPTDFVLVLDNSGSMLEDCLYGKTRPDVIWVYIATHTITDMTAVTRCSTYPQRTQVSIDIE